MVGGQEIGSMVDFYQSRIRSDRQQLFFVTFGTAKCSDDSSENVLGLGILYLL